MGRLKQAVAESPNGRPARRVQEVLAALSEDDRADVVDMLSDLKVSAHAIEAVLRRECKLTLARGTIITWRENNAESCHG